MHNLLIAIGALLYGGRSVIYWFQDLPPDKQEKVLALAKGISQEVFKQAFGELASHQASRVLTIARDRFAG